MKILVLNSGSSSQKTCLYDVTDHPPLDPPSCLWEAKIEWDGPRAVSTVKTVRTSVRTEHAEVPSRTTAIEQLLATLWSGDQKVLASPKEIHVVGHRVVHGGPRFLEPSFVTADVKAAINDVSAFAPLHNRAELQGMEIVEKIFGNVPQVAVFDTGFHRNMPAAAQTYPGPYEWLEQGIHRYGFHGINHEYCASRAAQMLGKRLTSLRLVSCHLGNGCSLAAIHHGVSVDTTMGFTPLEGLMMGTRSGSVDPGILTYLVRQHHLTGEQLDDLLNKKSGLQGISGISGDMRDIVSAMKMGNARAQLAFDMYVNRLQTGIGAMTAALEGLDALIFTAGVGENSQEVRGEVCAKLRFLGIEVDETKNGDCHPDQNIAAENSLPVLVVRAQEDWAIAKQCWALISASSRTR
jgi:acetate kinase